ncbi:hypothetical protein ACCS60_27115 [Rhizobium acaciae]|uniref:hypothetical protein n=1 Tax=Rhizobium acaciae TaxID=2989736 RepID=UPI003F997B85
MRSAVAILFLIETCLYAIASPNGCDLGPILHPPRHPAGGAFTIAVSVGPQTALDDITHAVKVLLLVTGLVWLARSRSASSLG